MVIRYKLYRIISVLLLLTASVASPALATDGNLPGGTAISVQIDTPTDGTVLLPTGDVTLQGVTSIGEGQALPLTMVTYVADVSGSTGNPGCGGDQNGDGQFDTILDCEIASIKAFNAQAITRGTVSEVGLVAFSATGVLADLGPSAGEQNLTGPGTDANANGTNDVDEVLSSLNYGSVHLFTRKNVNRSFTNFADGLSAAVNIINLSTQPGRMIVFLSDSSSNTGAHINTVMVPTDVSVFTFAVGVDSNCTYNPNNLGSLQEMAAMGNGLGYCTNVANVADLPDLLPQVIKPLLSKLTLSVDGGGEVDISSSAIPALPLEGPNNTAYTYSLQALTVGAHTLCVNAYGSDAGGEGSVQDCVQVTVPEPEVYSISLAPKEATNELGAPGQTHTVVATIANTQGVGLPDTAVAFLITSGPNSGQTLTANTDVNGQTSFTYTAQQAPIGIGTDTIQACFTDPQSQQKCDTAVKHWVERLVQKIVLTPIEATNELSPGAQTHTVIATLSDQSGMGLPNTPVTFSITSGPNTGQTFTGNSDSLGQVAFTYTGVQGAAGIGTDTIQACFTDYQGQQLCETALKHWVDQINPLIIQLTPEEDTNELAMPDTPHTVTATITDEWGAPVASRAVTFTIIAGPNGDLSQSVTFSTDASGQAPMTYYGMPPPGGVGTDTIQACFSDNQGQILCDTAIKHWVDNIQPLVLLLTPEEATNELGTPGQTHTVSAVVRDEYGHPIVDRLVTFTILTGPNFGQAFSANTDASGLTSFTYEAIQGIPGIGTDTIQACVTDNQGQPVCDTALKHWVLPIRIFKIELTPADASNELGTADQTHTVTAKITDEMDSGVAEVEVAFEITAGPNAGKTFTAGTDTSGQVEFSYAGKQGLAGLGTDTIQACFEDPQGEVKCDTAVKHWVDTTPPIVACTDSVNPSGQPLPPGKTSNGFFRLVASDSVDPNVQIFVLDSGSGKLFGPFASGTTIKYTQAAGAKPSQVAMSGEVDWHITGNGDPVIYAVDSSGNRSTSEVCPVPPPGR